MNHTDLPNHLYQRQRELEEDMRAQGTKRFRDLVATAKQKERESETSYGSRLLANVIIPISDGISKLLEAASSGAPGRRHAAVRYLQLIEPDVAAYLAAKGIIDGLSRRLRLSRTAVMIGSMIEDEVRFLALKEAEGVNHKTGKRGPVKNYFKKVIEGLNEDTNHYERKRAVLVHCAKKLKVDWEEWPDSEKLHLGIKLIDIVRETTGAVEVVTFASKRKKTDDFIVATAKTEEWMKERLGWGEIMCPLHQPMLIPPVDWTKPVGGGYLSETIPKLKLVKSRNKAYQEELFSVDLGLVYRAVNGLQKTAWKINPAVYSVMKEAWETNAQVGELPNREHKELPIKPVDIATNKDSRLQWRREAHKVNRENHKMGSKLIQVDRTIRTAGKFLDEKAIYFPYQLDFRGRVYCVPSDLSPQGHDIAKGLLTFAEGKALGTKQAADWLAIHGANLYGYDKVSLADRVKWVADNKANIIKSVMAPLDYRWWCQDGVDKPWQFLAFCYEWVGYLKEGLGYVSHLPVALDGSCNGLQHFSAMLRDPIGGAATNLTPADKPRDIYQTVADRVIEKLTADGSELAQKWLAFGITRKTTKRPVMVVPYGGTRHSCRDYIIQYVKEQKRPHPFGDDKGLFKAGLWLSKFVWDGISETVVAARDAMGWLQQVSRVVSKEAKPLNWTVPTGFPVQQAYYDVESYRVETTIAGSIIKLHLNKDIEDLDKRRQAQGVSPNFVHSLDAAALVFTVDMCLDCEIESFAMIHDSYATHAADTDTLRGCLRAAFCGLYQTDVLKAFRDEIQNGLPAGVELPPLPPQGTLDINQVLKSDFFFA